MADTLTILQIGAALAGSATCIKFLAWLCKPVKFVELMRFQGNDVARNLYHARSEVAGAKARQAKPVGPAPEQFQAWENEGGAL